MPARTDCPNTLIHLRFGQLRYALLLSLAIPVSAIAMEDPYLSAISIEAKKVDAATQPILDNAAPRSTYRVGASIDALSEKIMDRFMRR